MQHIIEEIFGKLDGATAIARGIGCPVQTVHDWLATPKSKPNATAEIPPWRRSAVLKFAADEKKLTELSPEALAYLQSTDRAHRQAAA